MKTRTGKINGLAALVALVVWCARAYDNPCIEQIQTNGLTCVYQGGVAPGYVLAPGSLTVGVGQPIPLPAISGLVLTNGWESYSLTYQCTPELNGTYYSPIVYNNGVLNFAPPIPPVLWTPGSCTYTALVVAAGSPCQPLTNQVGVVTVTVSSNQPDALIDVDFGGAVHGSKLGYAAIGDSPTDLWNYYLPGGNVVVGALGNLLTAEGRVSPVGLVVTNLARAGVNGSPDPMYNDYLFTNAASATVSLTNVPTGTWTVYLYAGDGNFNLKVGGADYGTRTNYDQPLSGVFWGAGVQYSVFTNVAVSNGLPVTIVVNPGRSGAAMLSGLQLVSASHNFPPAITAQPVDVNTNLGAKATFSVGATGSPLSYQWLKNGAPLSEGARILGAHASTLTVSNVSLQDAALYSVVVSNADGTVASHYAALRIWNPSLECAWGYGGNGQTNVPTGLTNAVATAAGAVHALALKGDGSVVAWGGNNYYNYGQTNVPAGLTNVVAIAAGGYHSLALRNDGTVVAWGYNGYAQTNVPAGLTNVVAIAAGDMHSLALKNDGTVVAWGDNYNGQCNVSVGLTNVVAIAGGATHSLALKPDGTVVAWGNGGFGQCNVPAGLSNVVAIAAGRYHNLAFKNDGTVVAWGYNPYGQCNVPTDLSNVVAIAAGGIYSLALKNDDTIQGWGDNTYGETAPPPGVSNVVAIAAGSYVSLALVDLGLNPTNGNNVQLAYFPFDNTNTWAGSAGQLPLVTNNVVGVASWSTNALKVDSANPAALVYRGVESNGAANLACSQGTVSLWVKPNWSSPVLGGSGPQNEGRLLEVGSAGPTNDWWALGVDAAGSSLYFATQINSSATRTTNLTATLNWTSNTWHQVVLTYSSSSSCLYLDGVPVVTDGAGVTAYPRLSVLNQGIAVGSSAAGTNQVHGVLDELATYNYVLSAATIASNYQAAVMLDSDGDGLPNMIENQLGLDPYAYNSPYGLGSGNGLQVFTPLKH